jgi:hypothetical protein
MKNRVFVVALICAALGWLPYLSLQLYWQHLIATVPGAEHGEISGPVLYFLPKLFVAAAIVTLGAVCATIAAVCLGARTK